ncbi:hypothetical protein FB45DRAFT_1116451 [Roridomyces roridus]|uniref:Uncharacterized protein n=1 Tax=Roridomyces roridus TaxID=1738132 RepID=A0AAD7CCI8_9AGAR|nr:hypothetical protein FB45DRAFT_1116451 [Roridomyces roridus]
MTLRDRGPIAGAFSRPESNVEASFTGRRGFKRAQGRCLGEKEGDVEGDEEGGEQLVALIVALIVAFLVAFPTPVFCGHLDRPRSREDPGPPVSDGVQLELERLAFWSSDDIAPLVRKRNMAPRHWRVTAESHTDPPHILMTSFLHCLGNFIGLKTLYARQVNFTQEGLAHLCRISPLAEIVINWCGVFPGETIDTTSLQLRTKKLRYLADDDQHRNVWLSIVDREHLRDLEAGGSASVADGTMSDGPAFPNVHDLKFNANLSTIDQDLTLLSKFPAVCALRLLACGDFHHESTDLSSLCASDVLPLLREYRGLCALLHIFLPKHTLTRLIIDVCQPGEFISQLHREYDHITMLNLDVNALDQDALSTICGRFPALLDLQVYIFADIGEGEYQDGINPVATDFFSAFASDTPGLPSTLQRLAISWDFHFQRLHSDESEDEPVASLDKIPDFLASGRSLGGNARR